MDRDQLLTSIKKKMRVAVDKFKANNTIIIFFYRPMGNILMTFFAWTV